MNTTLSEHDQNRLARRIQSGFPLVLDPYAALAEDLNLSPEAILSQLEAWTEDGKLREISAVLEGAKLGWDSALVAATVPGDRIVEVAAIVSAHPTVTHNYQRDHEFNLWFTIAVPPHMGLDHTLALLAKEAGVESFMPLRRTLTFKIGVNFDLKKRTSATTTVALPGMDVVEVGPAEALKLRALQTPLPMVRRPYEELAEIAQTSAEELLEFANAWMGGAIRRYVGTFRHRRLGVKGNGMAVWNIPEADQAELGTRLAGAPEVTHCYARNEIEGFPYTTYSMIHGPDRESVQQIAERLSGEIGVNDYLVLFSTQEFKKVRLRYFLPELDAWWNARVEECVA